MLLRASSARRCSTMLAMSLAHGSWLADTEIEIEIEIDTATDTDTLSAEEDTMRPWIAPLRALRTNELDM